MPECKVFVGNVNFKARKEDLKEFFSECRSMGEVAIILDRDTGRSKGYAFIMFDSDEAANDAVAKMDGKDFQGRPLKVKLAQNQDNNRTFSDFRIGRDNNQGSYDRGYNGGGYGDMGGRGGYGGYGHDGYGQGGYGQGGYGQGGYGQGGYDQQSYGGYGGGDYARSGYYNRGERGGYNQYQY